MELIVFGPLALEYNFRDQDTKGTPLTIRQTSKSRRLVLRDVMPQVPTTRLLPCRGPQPLLKPELERPQTPEARNQDVHSKTPKIFRV